MPTLTGLRVLGAQRSQCRPERVLVWSVCTWQTATVDVALANKVVALEDYHWWFKGRRRIICGELDRLALAHEPRILDAGCGSGGMLEQLSGYGNVSGIELDTELAEVARARERGEVRIGRIEQLPWQSAHFDLITCLDVIEHTPDDQPSLRELWRVARPGGWLVLTVPAYPSLWSYHDELNHHYRRYTRGTLRSAAAASGWRLQRLTSFNTLLLAPAAAVRLVQRWWQPADKHSVGLERLPEWLNQALEWPLRLEARALARGFTLPMGLSLLAVLRKPA